MKYKNILLPLFLFSLNLFADETCSSSPRGIDDVVKVLGKKCLTSEMGKADLVVFSETEDATREFCEQCKSEALKSFNSSDTGRDEREALYANATLNEFQKELTMITLDLMKMRSAYKLDFDPRKAVEECNFNKLPAPSCSLTEDQRSDFLNRKKTMQKSLANELAYILSNSQHKNDSLLNREKRNLGNAEKNCEASDRDILFAQTRYQESLLTPDLISRLKALKIPDGQNVESFLLKTFPRQGRDEKTNNLFKTIAQLQKHPLINNLLTESSKLNVFLSQIKNNDKNSDIIEKLSDNKSAKKFGDTIARRCEESFNKTSKYLDQIYCKNTPNYIATNSRSMEIVAGKEFAKMDEEKAESHIQVSCAQLNAKSKDDMPFSTISDDLNKYTPPLLAQRPLVSFQTMAYDDTFTNYKIEMCNAREQVPTCTETSSDSGCTMLRFFNLSKESTQYKEMANASSDNINKILLSLIGEEKPEKAEHIVLLQKEGILPGGDTSTRPQQQDAATFFKTVNSGNTGTNATPIPLTKTTQNAATQFKPTTGTTAAVDESSDEDPASTSKSTTSNNFQDIKKTDKKFSALSDEEQQNILNRMKPKSKAGKSNAKGFSPDAQKDSDPFFANSAQETSAESLNGRGPATTSITAPTNPLAQNTSGSKSGNYAKIDPTVVKKDGSYNKALEQANTNDRSPASNPVEETKFALTKNESGLNEIEIKVADESILEKKTPELEKKIQEYLEKSGQSLTGAKKGEAFIVKLGKYKIKVAINDYGAYVATCAKGDSIHPEYLAFLSRYFTGIKERVSSRLSMEKIINEESVKRN